MTINRIEEGVSVAAREAWEVYAENIAPGEAVVVVGPSIHPTKDATLLYAAHRLADAGVLYVVDPQAGPELKHEDPHQIGPVVGVGHIPFYLGALEALRGASLELATPVWLGLQSGMWHIKLPGELVDVVVDHATACFLLQYDLASNEMDVYEKNLRRALQEYHRILKPNGKLLFQVEAGDWSLRVPGDRGNSDAVDVATLMENVGFQVAYERVSDIVRVPISQETWSRHARRPNLLSSRSIAPEAILSAPRWSENEIVFEHPAYPSPDFFVATKTA